MSLTEINSEILLNKRPAHSHELCDIYIKNIIILITLWNICTKKKLWNI